MAEITNPEALAVGLYDRGFIRLGDFSFPPIPWSPIYINLGGVGSLDHTSGLSLKRQLFIRDKITDAYAVQLDQFNECQHILGIPEAALTIAGLVGYAADTSVLQLRVKEKNHGIPKGIEGNYREGQSVVLLDDVITLGTSKLRAKNRVEEFGLAVSGIAVLVDREQGGVQEMAQEGIRVEAAIGMSTLIEILAAERRIDTSQAELLKRYFAGEITERPA